MAAMLSPDDMQESFAEFVVKEPDLMRPVLQAAVSSLQRPKNVSV